MKRREFLKKTAMGFTLCLAGQTACTSFSKKPNILFIFADDMCHEALSALGSQAKTPNLDRLVQRGVRFSNAYNQGAWNGAVCIASRTMMNTGRFVWHAEKLDQNLQDEKAAGRMWSQMMSQHGYQTYFSGKWHVKIQPEEIFDNVTHVRPGMPKDHFDWNDPNKHHVGYDRPVKGKPDEWSPSDPKWGGFWQGGKHWSEVLGDDGTSYLQQAATEKDPFFMYLAFNAPHDPRQSPQSYVDQYPAEEIDVPVNFQPLYPYKDEIGCDYGLRDERLAPFPRTEYAVRVHRQEYYAIITHMDDQVGRLLDELEKTGQADNTWIFFTADHGLAVGRHGLFGKQNMYEHSLKAPLIINGPGVPAGKTIDTPVYIQDIIATALDIAGHAVPEHIQFNSLLPLVEDKKALQYPAIYGGYLDLQRMVRKGDYKLIHYPQVPVTLLYNLKKDPFEMVNLADDPDYADVISDLKSAMQTLQKETGDTLELNW